MSLFGLISWIRNLPREAWVLLKDTVGSWREDNAMRMAAALAFYATFSLGPALLIGLGVAGAFIGSEEAKTQLIVKVREFVSPDAANYVLTVLDSFWGQFTERRLPIIGIAAAALAGTAVFVELHGALNTIWNGETKNGSGVVQMVYSRALSFVLVVGIGVVILVSVAATTVLVTVNAFFSRALPVPHQLLDAANYLINFAMVPISLALAYKLVPDAEIAWKDVWLGAIVASLLFIAGKRVFGIYLGLSAFGSVYGAAGSLVILLAWVYYSAQVFFFGAELTKVYAYRYGSRAEAGKNTGPHSDDEGPEMRKQT